MVDRRDWSLPGDVVVHTAMSDLGDGDLSLDAGRAELAERRARLAPVPFTWLRQVHGRRVVAVGRPGDRAGEEADGAVTDCEGAALSVQVADCAPVLLWSAVAGPRRPGAVVAAVHAGWKGLEAGVLAAAARRMRERGATDLNWMLGPCISAAAYEFSPGDLDRLAAEFGPGVVAHTSEGRPALDLRSAVASALDREGATAAVDPASVVCTATSPRHWSHRARGDTERQVGVIWWEAGGDGGTATGSRS